MKLSEQSIFYLIIQLIDNSKNAIILTHQNPDGDAIGSVLGLNDYLQFLELNVSIFKDTKIPENFEFLEGINQFTDFTSELSDSFNKADVIFVLDLSSGSRLKDFEPFYNNSPAKKIVIDHHLEPKIEFDILLHDIDACSTGELIFNLLASDKRYSFNKNSASALYVAIMTDTGNFRFPRTDADVHEIIARLINAGADPVDLYDKIYNQNSKASTRLLSEGFLSMRFFYDDSLVMMVLTKEMFLNTGCREDEIENYAEKLLSIKSARAGVLISQVPTRNELRISFRSKDDINVRKIAEKFGGGGHLNASGARIYDSNALEETIEKIVTEFKGIL